MNGARPKPAEACPHSRAVTDADPAFRWLFGSHLERRVTLRSPGQPAYARTSRTATRSQAEGSNLLPRGLLACPGTSEPPLLLPPLFADSVDAFQPTYIFLCQTRCVRTPLAQGGGHVYRSLRPCCGCCRLHAPGPGPFLGWHVAQ